LREIFLSKLKVLNQYIVAFNGLDNADYDFDFKVKDEFFTCFENSEIKGGELDVKLILTKKPHSLELNISIKGKVKIICDRCLEEFTEKIKFSDSIPVEFGEVTNFDTDEDFVILSKSENEINISQFIYEFAHFALPFTRTHHNDKSGKSGCNPEMLAIIEKLRPKNEDVEADPRWAKLAEIKNNNVK
jgi:uncharacterized protein